MGDAGDASAARVAADVGRGEGESGDPRHEPVAVEHGDARVVPARDEDLAVVADLDAVELPSAGRDVGRGGVAGPPALHRLAAEGREDEAIAVRVPVDAVGR